MFKQHPPFFSLAMSLLCVMLVQQTIWAQPTSFDVKEFISKHKVELDLAEVDYAEIGIQDQYQTEHLGVTHIYVQQKFRDIVIHNALLNLNVKDDRLLSAGNRFVRNITERVGTSTPSLKSEQGLRRAAEHLGKAIPTAFSEKTRVQNQFGESVQLTYDKGSWAREDIKVSLCWLPTNAKHVLLCWKVEIYELDEANYWQVFVDAQHGGIVLQENLVRHCAFYSHGTDQTPKTNDVCDQVFPIMADSSYRVFAMPIESPNHGSRTLEISPWNGAGVGNPATTLGWHDDGTTQYIITRGNNVYAYEDRDANDVPGFSPSSPSLQFDYAFDPLLAPIDNEEAAITNLFYWNNIIHDVVYQYGFDEVAGNFQNNNLSRGGVGGDDVLAEAQDGEDTNNANFLTLPDGNNGVMQMFLWSPVPSTSPFLVNSPVNIAGSYFALESDFSINNKLDNLGSVTGDLVQVDDLNGGSHEACNANPMNNGGELSGKIALIDRGNCDFTEKVKNAQDSGAVAVLMVNNVEGEPIVMGGTDNTITIPALMISRDDGDLIRGEINGGNMVNMTFMPVPTTIPDGDFDNGIIAHEYGHGVSTRLTGGPSSSSCLNNDEQMGEGWSDYLGLMLTTDWAVASETDKRGIGTYSIGSPTDGTGIRTYPYTTDLAINPFTYADVPNAPIINGQVSPHFVGSVWATMLWDMTWKIIELEAADSDMYHGSGGNNIALQLVMDGLKLQPCSPGFVDGRDAILLADEIQHNGKYRCAIWEAFSRRGLGVDAQQNDTDDHMDGVTSFDVPSGFRVEHMTDLATIVEGSQVTIEVLAICDCVDKTNIKIREILPVELMFIESAQGILQGDSLCFDIASLNAQDTASFSFIALVQTCQLSADTMLSLDDAEGSDKYTSTKLAGMGNKNWVKNSALSNSPSNSWYAQDYNNLADIALTLNAPVQSPGLLRIGFYHRYETEATFDGGIVELSLDGGTTWFNAEPHFSENGYPSAITTVNTNSPIAGSPAFTGDSDDQFGSNDFIMSTIEYCLREDQSLLVRFRFVCDGAVAGPGINGWYIDDISISRVSGFAIQTETEESGQFIDSVANCFAVELFAGSAAFVDINALGSGTGLNWMDAIKDLAPAMQLAGCRYIDTIFVAEGVYYPNTLDDPSISFFIPDSTVVLGG
ncbi:MAG: M36 family metallopeptidase, partial [Saprospiraceae bacterium]|nr:M36 family metallopeptidase [Saprospiraceae bacterium]